ncbi:MAG: hypothetical protein RRA15_10415 [bacterium]|nr:hypothetical protein [bacterium]
MNKENEFRQTQIQQRSEFQFKIHNLNIITSGALMSFALTTPGNYVHALLIIPVLSFSLFMLWVHHGIVIRLYRVPKYGKGFWENIRKHTFSVAILANFVGVPIIALVLYQKSEYLWLQIIDFGLIVLTTIFYGLWFYLQYKSKVTSEQE